MPPQGALSTETSGRTTSRWRSARLEDRTANPIALNRFDLFGDTADHIARQLIPRHNHFRFQFPLDREYEAMDNSHPKNLDVFTHLFTDYIDSGEGRRKLHALVGRLNTTR